MDDDQVEYRLRSMDMPYLSGLPLRLIAGLLESPLRGLLAPTLFRSAGIEGFRSSEHLGLPTLAPIYVSESPAIPGNRIAPEDIPDLSANVQGFPFPGIRDFAMAYRDGSSSPLDVAQRILGFVDEDRNSETSLNAIVALDREMFLEQARESTERFRNGNPLSLLDGVPVGVKDEVDVSGYPTGVGTAFLGSQNADEDAEVVARFRSLGAIFPGKLNMHEIGIGVTGFNPHHGPTRNPYDTSCYTGGSSSGAGTAVASGLCPLAIGADGGGSIRIPASFCGVFGLKPTYGRVSEFGAAPLAWSVAHLGPLASSVDDLVLGYGIMAGSDLKDPNSRYQPEPDFPNLQAGDLKGVRLGIYPEWFHHADNEVVLGCQTVVDQWVSRGVEVLEIALPELEEARVAHTLTIAAEMSRALDDAYRAHRKEFGLDVRINLALARLFSARDYIHAQQVRTRMMEHFRKVFRSVDAVVTPSTALAAPTIPATAFPHGDSDLSTLMEIMRFATPANLTGLPAISCPAGYTRDGRPLGIQAMGRPWEEAGLIRLAYHAESFVERTSPEVFFRLLPE